jgi:cystathionine beta-synthase
MIEAAGGTGGSSWAAPLSKRPPAIPGWASHWWAAAWGYRTVLVVPDKMAREKVLPRPWAPRSSPLGRRRGHPDYYQTSPRRRKRTETLHQPVCNPANPKAHETTSARDLPADAAVDAIVAGVGSGGTLTGIGREKVLPGAAMILADPEARCLRPMSRPGR